MTNKPKLYTQREAEELVAHELRSIGNQVLFVADIFISCDSRLQKTFQAGIEVAKDLLARADELDPQNIESVMNNSQ